MSESESEKLKSELWKRMADSPFVMFGLQDGEHSEPLTAQLDEDQVDTLYFLIGKDNRAAKGGPAMMQFVSKGHDFFACLAGTATTTYNRALIDKYWNRWAEAWFPGGKDDPNLTLLRFDIDSAELWDANTPITAKIKLLFGGTINRDEAGDHAVVQTTAENTPR